MAASTAHKPTDRDSGKVLHKRWRVTLPAGDGTTMRTVYFGLGASAAEVRARFPGATVEPLL